MIVTIQLELEDRDTPYFYERVNDALGKLLADNVFAYGDHPSGAKWTFVCGKSETKVTCTYGDVA